MSRLGKLFIVAAPSGGGKTSLIKALLSEVPDIKMSVSHTTRKMREGEEEGIDYFYVSKDEFTACLNDGVFLEHATVFGEYYGTSGTWVDKTLGEGVDVILEIDWQGAQQVRTLKPNATSIFILPPSREILEERLRDRNLDDPEDIETRLNESIHEMSHYGEYDYLIVNDDFSRALNDFKIIVASHRLETGQQESRYAGLIKELLK